MAAPDGEPPARSITDLAEQEDVTVAYVCRILADVVEAILDGRQPKGLRLAEMLGNGPLMWDAQRSHVEIPRANPTRL